MRSKHLVAAGAQIRLIGRPSSLGPRCPETLLEEAGAGSGDRGRQADSHTNPDASCRPHTRARQVFTMLAPLLLAALPALCHGFLLDSVTSKSLMDQLAQVSSLDDAKHVISLIVREVDELKRVVNTHEVEVNQLKGEVDAHQVEMQQLRQTLRELTAAVTSVPTTAAGWGSGGGGGASFTRWGRTSCPSESELVYKGYSGGKGSAEAGGGTNLLCLPEDPQWANYTVTKAGAYYAHVYGAEYAIPKDPLPNFHINHDVPCAVCRSPTRSTALMVPAHTSCHPGFHKEYTGYLMSNYYANAGDYEFVCVDAEPESEAGSQGAEASLDLYFAVGVCGSLPCPPYEANREIACVVCTK